jgi:hypothetical protein
MRFYKLYPHFTGTFGKIELIFARSSFALVLPLRPEKLVGQSGVVIRALAEARVVR